MLINFLKLFDFFILLEAIKGLTSLSLCSNLCTLLSEVCSLLTFETLRHLFSDEQVEYMHIQYPTGWYVKPI